MARSLRPSGRLRGYLYVFRKEQSTKLPIPCPLTHLNESQF